MSVRTTTGFTLIEMLIAMAIGTLLLAVVANTFINQRETYAIREQVSTMQQNVMGGMDFIVRELAMAGYDPTEGSGAGIVVATANLIQVSMDLSNDGDTGDADENVTYVLYDAQGDGDLDLGRNTGGGNQLVALNMQSLALTYTLADGTVTAAPADLSQIRTISVTLIARTADKDQQYPDNGGYRTVTLNSTVRVRNLGL